MTRVPPGALGHVHTVPDPPALAPTAYRAACHAAVRLTRRLTHWEPRRETPTFHAARIAGRRGDWTVLRHAHLRPFAIAEPDSRDGPPVRFARPPDLADALTTVSGAPVPPPDHLATPLEPTDLSALDPAERRDLTTGTPPPSAPTSSTTGIDPGGARRPAHVGRAPG